MSLYSIAHKVQAGLPWLWNMVEWGNSTLFSLQHKEELRNNSKLLEKYQARLAVSEVQLQDCEELAAFFNDQPEDAFKFFKPHEFDLNSLTKLARRKSFLMFKVTDGDRIVGYFFLRCFANGDAFKGRMVDYRRRNQGIAKLMGTVLNEIVLIMGLRLYTTISPENYSSFASTQAVNDIKIIKVLENGSYFIKCFPMKQNKGGLFDNIITKKFEWSNRRAYPYAV